MLILSRKKDESIIIDQKIEIKVIAIEEGKVRLGISAPKDLEVHRKEIYIEIQKENKKAAVGNLSLKGLGNLLKK
ncbi:carbon storage regulator CsrA [Crassaminicella indica]|uniref:Translational regulator CsrA n=1 Tax=Crassaminicella indica TaxID=2855394 RepID=A0ABX8RA77_9CLOT|nr:carbon storage regulator CsrA [Crassaminicella indica]QXM05167.1 carbon storage regulator CsrA [Crassaminicella indica]